MDARDKYPHVRDCCGRRKNCFRCPDSLDNPFPRIGAMRDPLSRGTADAVSARRATVSEDDDGAEVYDVGTSVVRVNGVISEGCRHVVAKYAMS